MHTLTILHAGHQYEYCTNGTRFSAIAHACTDLPLLPEDAYERLSAALAIWQASGDNDLALVLTSNEQATI